MDKWLCIARPQGVNSIWSWWYWYLDNTIGDNHIIQIKTIQGVFQTISKMFVNSEHSHADSQGPSPVTSRQMIYHITE